jgi:hypothetical protein
MKLGDPIKEVSCLKIAELPEAAEAVCCPPDVVVSACPVNGPVLRPIVLQCPTRELCDRPLA